ncbi:MAG: hypothetical protein H6631_17550 [Anaerolineaceae bacterium]|nr:hypothetical protein [Anaerolineaceae bacterium]MCB9101897.1 hypothetical protein [Anaerolineales bacterium]
MALNGTRTYVGFGFGAIQAGLFLYEAYQSGAFRRLAVAEIVPDVVENLHRANQHYAINIAQPDRVSVATIGPVEIENPAVDTDRELFIEAIAEAEEIGTAIPSVTFYTTDRPHSLHRVLAEGLRRKAAVNGPRCVVYAAENHHRAAQILEAAVMDAIPPSEQEAVRSQVRFLNTVIGKMSGVITDGVEMEEQRLTPITPGEPRAFLVEEFNQILITKVDFNASQPFFRRGIAVFEEKDNLRPFEEAKLYGHNATHALAAYLGKTSGIERLSQLNAVPGAIPFLRAAFLEESGQALIRKYGGYDPLFTPAGYRLYVDDLLHRMMNPYLRDTVERVGRDPRRKLGWDDRLIGTMRLALSQGITPHRYAIGAAAALAVVEPLVLKQNLPIAEILLPLWTAHKLDNDEATTVLALVEDGVAKLKTQKWF